MSSMFLGRALVMLLMKLGKQRRNNFQGEEEDNEFVFGHDKFKMYVTYPNEDV